MYESSYIDLFTIAIDHKHVFITNVLEYILEDS